MKIAVLMSTYNGEAYLPEQLDSIFAQEGVEVELFVRDDGSTDGTVALLSRCQAQHPNMTVCAEGGAPLGPCRSFFKLMAEHTGFDYYALADQDDIWDANKLLCAVRQIESRRTDLPVMYFSNLRIVDANNVYYRDSHTQNRELRNKYTALAENAATGCTIVYNNALAQIAHTKKPQNFSMHDAWVYTVCALFGEVIYDFEPHINYRQHGNNAIGASLRRVSYGKIFRQLARLFDRSLQPRYDNAVELLREFGTDLCPADLAKVLEIVNYKRNFKNRLQLLRDPDLALSEQSGRLNQIRFKLLVLLGIF